MEPDPGESLAIRRYLCYGKDDSIEISTEESDSTIERDGWLLVYVPVIEGHPLKVTGVWLCPRHSRLLQAFMREMP